MRSLDEEMRQADDRVAQVMELIAQGSIISKFRGQRRDLHIFFV